MHTHQSVPVPFVLLTTAGVAENRELQGIGKLYQDTAFDSLQFVEAFCPVVNRLAASATRSPSPSARGRRSSAATRWTSTTTPNAWRRTRSTSASSRWWKT